MYRVLIAEDEMLVRIGIKNSMDWSAFGLEVAGNAADGLQAWDFYAKYSPEIVITDIRMPGMDGMELIRRIREKDSATRIIILSCVDDFHMVQQAMTYGVSGYILKLTITTEEIEVALRKAVSELKQLRIEPRAVKPLASAGEDSALFFREVLINPERTERELREAVGRRKLRLTAPPLTVCLAELTGKRGADSEACENGLAADLFRQVLQANNRGEVFPLGNQQYAVVFSFPDLVSSEKIRSEILRILHQIGELVSQYFGLTATFFVSPAGNGFSEICSLYGRCAGSLQQTFFTGCGGICFTGETDGESNLRRYVMPALQDCLQASVKAFGEDYRAQFVKSFPVPSAASCCSPDDVKLIFCELLQVPLQLTGKYRQNVFLTQMQYADRIRGAQTLQDACAQYREYLFGLSTILGENINLSADMLRAIEYIRKHYQDNISLRQISEYAELSPNYLSTLFKKELKVNFIDYLQTYRLEKAEDQLLHSDKKLTEISQETGFCDVSYFCRVFKSTTGFRPNEFRRKFSDGAAGAAAL